MKPALFFVGCVAALPAVLLVSTAATYVWFERVWLPQIAGDE